MEKIAIITDSACDLPSSDIQKYNINVLPFRIIYSDKEYLDGVTITPQEVYKKLPDEIPTTSLPSMETIEELLSKLETEGYTHVICIHISINLSGTLNSVRIALENHPNLNSFVYDTKTLTQAQGNIILEVAKMIENRKSFNEIINELPNIRKKSHCYFTLDTLTYLKKGGRIGRVAGTIGELLNLKPIIEVADDGIYNTYAKVRGRKQSLKKLHAILEDYLQKGNCKISILQGASEEDCKIFYDSVKDDSRITSLRTGPISPALGVHTGPGLIGVIIQEE